MEWMGKGLLHLLLRVLPRREHVALVELEIEK